MTRYERPPVLVRIGWYVFDYPPPKRWRTWAAADVRSRTWPFRTMLLFRIFFLALTALNLAVGQPAGALAYATILAGWWIFAAVRPAPMRRPMLERLGHAPAGEPTFAEHLLKALILIAISAGLLLGLLLIINTLGRLGHATP